MQQSTLRPNSILFCGEVFKNREALMQSDGLEFFSPVPITEKETGKGEYYAKRYYSTIRGNR